MINYKSWCRLCGSFDDCEVVDPEITDIIQNVFDVSLSSAKFDLDILCLNLSSSDSSRNRVSLPELSLLRSRFRQFLN